MGRDTPLIIAIDPASGPIRDFTELATYRADFEPVLIDVLPIKIERPEPPLKLMQELDLHMSRGERRHGNPGRWSKKRLFRP